MAKRLLDRLRAGEWTFLLAITAIAATLRFAWLSRPTLWNDEAMTFWRVAGSHERLIALLRHDGFGPLHYELYWLLGRWLPLTPGVMRLLPALWGTLMVPATYWLARELFDRRVARLAAVFASASAFLMAYSRDAKMYMQTWFAITLFAACLLAFLRTRCWWIGLLGLLAGSIALWTHATGWCVVPLGILVLVIDRRARVRETIVVLLGLALMCAGPIWYITSVNQVYARSNADNMGLTGIGWVNNRAAEHTPFALMCDVLGAYSHAYSWIDEPQVQATRVPWLTVANAIVLSIVGCLGVLAIARPRAANANADAAPLPLPTVLRPAWLLLTIWSIVPLYGLFRASGFEGPTLIDAGRWLITPRGGVALLVGVGCFALAAATSRFLAARIFCGGVAAVLLIWSIGLPIAWAVLLDRDSPVETRPWLVEAPLPGIVPVVGLALMLGLGLFRHPAPARARLRRALPPAIVAVIAVGWMVAIDGLLVGRQSPGAMWMPRYVGFTFPAMLVAAAALALRLPWTPLRYVAVGAWIAINLTQSVARIVCDTDPPLDRVAADVMRANVSEPNLLVYTRDAANRLAGPTATGSITNMCGRYYLYVAAPHARWPADFDRERGERPVIRETWSPAQIRFDLRTRPDVNRLIIWDRLPATGSVDAVARSREMPAPWVKMTDERYVVRSFWYWGVHYVYRRCEYTR